MEVLQSFTVAAVLVALGFLLLRCRVLPESAEQVFTRYCFDVAIPALLFVALIDADLGLSMGALLAAITISTAAVVAVFLMHGMLRRRGLAASVFDGFSASYVNGTILGIPIAQYVLGDVALAVPLVLFQLVIHVPITVGALDAITASADGAGVSRWVRWSRPARNPVVAAAVLGLVVNLAGISLPSWVLEPITLLSATMVPIGLLVFGMSLIGARLGWRALGEATAIASVGKLLLHPAIALGVGLLLSLPPQAFLALLLFSALPSGQTVYIYAARFGLDTRTARDTAVVTTVLSIPILLLISLLRPA